MADLRGQTIGGFRILDALQTGMGSQGAVYRAVCERSDFPGIGLGDAVALKVMSVNDESESFRRKLERRTHELIQLNHPNIVRYYGSFTVNDLFNDLYVIVEEYLSGESLKELLSRTPSGLDADEALRIANDVLSGFAYLSSVGIVHRDVKPGNIFLCSDGTVKLLDFEVARTIHDPMSTSGSGNIRGTFDYMAPEFTRPDFYGDVKSDIFSLGVVVHEMLTGKLPYPQLAGNREQANFAFMSRWERIDGGDVSVHVSSRVRRLLPGMVSVLERALSPARTNRYGTFEEFQAELGRVQFTDLRYGDKVYRLLRFIGKGGFGEVFKARLLSTGEYVAVKHLLKAAYAERFNREARIMSRFRDSCFVQLMDFFVLGDQGAQEAFLVMAFLEGMPGNSLRDAIRGAKGAFLDRTEVLRAFARYAHGLSVMHSQGVFHRDIKPSNLYYPAGQPDRAAIMDLGIARDEHGTATHGQVPGTLDYMPPEVIVSDSRGDSGMDIYALGLCLYEALTGKLAYPRLPSGTPGYTQFFARARSRQLPDFSDPAVENSPEILSLLREMTNPDERRRLKNAQIVEARLLACMRFRPPVSPYARLSDPVETYRGVKPVRAIEKPAPAPVAAPRSAVLSASRPVSRSPVGVRPVAYPSSSRGGSVPIGDWKRDRAGELKTALNVLLGVGIAGLLGFVGYMAFPSVKLAAARWSSGEVCDVYSIKGVDEGVAEEKKWMKRWSPQTGGWLAVAFPDFIECTNKLGAARLAAEKNALRMKVMREQAEERAACLNRLNGCRRIDGRLDEHNFNEIDGWSLPARLDGDPEVAAMLPLLGRCLAAAVRAKLEIEPVLTRRRRLSEAEKLMRNSWVARVLPSVEYSAVKRELDKAMICVAGVVGNGCSDAICVGDVVIPSGAAKTVIIEDGGIDAYPVTRAGYGSLKLPAGFDGMTVTYADSQFVPAPVKVSVPDLEDDVVCRIGDSSAPAGGMFMLSPGDYVCVYSKPGHMAQRRSFTVRVNSPVKLPEPEEWRRDGSDDLKKVKLSEKFARSPSALVSEPEKKEVDVRSMILRSIRRQCAAKLAVEPVATRQERLDEAGRILTRAVAVDRVVTEAEAASLYEAIENRRKWSVGKVCNESTDALTIGGYTVPAKSEKILIFENGLPERWIAQLPGYHPKMLMRDFDGLTLKFSNADFTPKDSVNSIPSLFEKEKPE